jgi:hypothetical protein
MEVQDTPEASPSFQPFKVRNPAGGVEEKQDVSNESPPIPNNNNQPKRKRGRPVGSKKVRFANDSTGKLNEQMTRDYVEDAEDELLRRSREMTRAKMAEWDRKRKEDEDARLAEEEERMAEEEANEEFEIKREFLQKIEMYYQYFPELQASCPRKTKWSLKSSIKDLEGELFRCDNELSLKRSLYSVKKADLFLKFAIEKLLVHGFAVPAHGLAAEAEKSQVLIESELKELAIKYKDWLDVSVECRYICNLVQQVGAVLQRNDELIKQRSENMSKVNMNKYDDL